MWWRNEAERRLQRRGRDADTETRDTMTAAVGVKMQMGRHPSAGEASLSPAKKRQREVATRPTSNRRAQNPAPVTPATQPAAPPTPAPKPAPQAAATQLATALGGVQFPPGLLAANPGLVGARPGSLVVVASPSKTDPGSQLLHVYMVSSRPKKDEGNTAGGSREPPCLHGVKQAEERRGKHGWWKQRTKQITTSCSRFFSALSLSSAYP